MSKGQNNGGGQEKPLDSTKGRTVTTVAQPAPKPTPAKPADTGKK